MIDGVYNTTDASLIVCPYCEHKKNSSCDEVEYLKDNEKLIECGRCGEEFWATAEIEVKFSTRKRKIDSDERASYDAFFAELAK